MLPLLIRKPLYKVNLVRKWIRSFFTNRNLSVTLYSKFYFNNEFRTWRTTTWMGQSIWKMPLDLWIYQELMYRLKPDVIIETGTNRGGSALYLAHLCDILGKGEVHTVDVQDFPEKPKHPRISYYLGSSTDDAIIDQIKQKIAPGAVVMVVLDSLHRKPHVVEELEKYGKLVSVGSYMILEDTYLNGYPVYPGFGPGPMEAVREYLPKHPEFVVDTDCEKFGVTWSPSGYLKKIK